MERFVMECDTLSPKELFQKDVRYLIPTFQRPYVWGHEEQWEPLWDDVRNTAERFLEELDKVGEEQRPQAERNTPSHFLGALVFQQQPTSTTEIDQRHVIDGQQRLTTLQLLLDAAQEVFEDTGHKSEARRLSKLVRNDEDLVDSQADYEFKVWPTRVDREAFRHAMTNGLAVDAFQDSRVVQAHQFFQLQIEEWLKSEDSSLNQRAAALETTLTGLLQMVVIDLELKDDSNIIFETLNARGTPLIESDLIKNFILYTAKASGKDEEQIYENYWKHLDDGWWREDARTGRLVRPRVDVFLNYWLSMRTVSEIAANKVFESFENYAKPKDIESVAADIKRVGDTYRQFEIDSVPDEVQFWYRIRTMEAGVVTPLLLLVCSASADQLAPDRRLRSLKTIESFLVRRMICRLTAKDYNRLFLELAEVIQRRGLEFADEIVNEFLKNQTADSREWPTDVTLKDAIVQLPIYRLLTRNRLRMVLEGIEGAMRGSKAEESNVPRNLTIEHLMPQEWREHWPLPSDQTDAETHTIDRNRMIHTVGNLTLVNNRLNPSLSNGPWTEKKDGLGDHSVLFLNKELLADVDSDTWSEETIQQRSVRLAKIASQVWPGP